MPCIQIGQIDESKISTLNNLEKIFTNATRTYRSHAKPNAIIIIQNCTTHAVCYNIMLVWADM